MASCAEIFSAEFFPPYKKGRPGERHESLKIGVARGRVCSPLPDTITTASGSPRADISRRRWRGGIMAYVPEWERLADALNRVVASGATEEQAKTDICNAIADRKIRLRFLTSKIWAEGKPGGSIGFAETQCDGSEVDIPAYLCPADFDWRISRQVVSWRKRGPDAWTVPYFENVNRMELFAADVTRVLINNASNANGRQIRRSNRSRASRELGEQALKALFQNGPPDRTQMTNQQLCGAVQDWLKKNSHRAISCDTILRAAGRR